MQWADAATLRAGVAAIQRGRARAAYPAAAAAAAAAAFGRHPAPLAGTLHGYAPVLNTLPVDGNVYYDPFLAAHASADPNYRLQVRKNSITGVGRTIRQRRNFCSDFFELDIPRIDILITQISTQICSIL